MSDTPEHDDVTGRGTTGHEWDGIKELDTPLPRWWLYTFYACIVVAVIYWVLMPAWPIGNGYTHGVLNFSDRRNVAGDVQTMQHARAPMYRQLASATPADLAANPELQQFARAAGESAFGDNCRTCHGAGGAGAPGYPNLADDVWIWGGSLADIEHTIRVGVRSGHPNARTSQMPAFGRDHLLTAQQVGDVTERVIAMSGARTRIQADAAAALRGAVVYDQQCAVCHGANGDGDRNVGAPSLRDDVWLYGGSREEIRRQVELGRGGVMPTWERRFDPGTIRALAFYVHEMGGGEPDVAAPAEPSNAGAPIAPSPLTAPVAPAANPAPGAPH